MRSADRLVDEWDLAVLAWFSFDGRLTAADRALLRGPHSIGAPLSAELQGALGRALRLVRAEPALRAALEDLCPDEIGPGATISRPEGRYTVFRDDSGVKRVSWSPPLHS